MEMRGELKGVMPSGAGYAMPCPACGANINLPKDAKRNRKKKVCRRCKSSVLVYYTNTDVKSEARDFTWSILSVGSNMQKGETVVVKTDDETIKQITAQVMVAVKGTIAGEYKQISDNVVRIIQENREKPEVRLVPALVPKDQKIGKGRHFQYVEVMEALTAAGQVLLVGPPGSGKSSIARDIAEDLKREYGYQACTEGMSEAKILGRKNLAGDYITSDYVMAFEGEGRFKKAGGLWNWDEVDALDANASLCVNEALANGHLNVPDREKKPIARKDDRLLQVACANTYGTGVSVEHTGRNALDAAFLDRFVGLIINFQYDVERERSIAAQYGIEPVAEKLWKIRANVLRAKIRRPVSTRAFIHLGKVHQVNKDVDLIARFFTGWADQEKSRAMEGVY